MLVGKSFIFVMFTIQLMVCPGIAMRSAENKCKIDSKVKLKVMRNHKEISSTSGEESETPTSR